jgi:hypothetical protein
MYDALFTPTQQRKREHPCGELSLRSQKAAAFLLRLAVKCILLIKTMRLRDVG